MVRLRHQVHGTDREFLDGLVTKVFEFGGGRVREHLGGIYDWLQASSDKGSEGGVNGSERGVKGTNVMQSEKVKSPSFPSPITPPSLPKENAYAARKEQQKQLKKAEKAVEESEKKIARMEQRLKELDQLLSDPKNASDMMLVTEYTDTKRQMDEEVERWEKLSEDLEALQG